jgi:hypothetical protein
MFLVAVSAFALTACNPFRHEPAVEVSAEDVNRNARWHGTVTSPSELAGVVQMTGTASMEPTSNGEKTRVALTLANAIPGGVHPWQLHRGQCGADEGAIGTVDTYQPAKVDRDGRASASATVPLQTPTTGNYFVIVRASATNAETIVACGNLAPPAQ